MTSGARHFFFFDNKLPNQKKNHNHTKKKKMSSFASQSAQYDAPSVEAVITDMEKELQDEQTLRSGLDATTADKITDAEQFLANNGERVADQLQRLQGLDQQIRSLVAENEQLQADDAEYHALITSDPYVELAGKIASIHAVAASLADFLVAKGRRGRPPM
jgi:uncharacterized protein (DUF3084 family)